MFGPVFRSELMRTARRRRHLVVRAGYGALLLAVLGISYLSAFHTPGVHYAAAPPGLRAQITLGQMAEFAHYFTLSYGMLQLFVALLVTLSVTAGTIAEERDRRTIEYLFVSHLTDSEIVLDKLLVRLLLVLSLLLAAVPVLALSMLFGGVDLSALFELGVLTTGTIVATASGCVYVSVTTRRGRDAFLRSLLLIVAGLTVPGMVYQALYNSNVVLPGWIDETLVQLRDMNPFVYLMRSDMRYQGGGSTSWDSLYEFVRNTGALSLVFLGMAVWQVRRAHLKSVAVPGASKRRPLRLFRPPQIGNYPLLWKELFAERFIQREHRWSTWIAPVGLAFVALTIVAYYGLCRAGFRDLQEYDFLEGADTIKLLLGCLFILLAGARGAISIAHEREQATWDTLLTTSLEAREIVLAKTFGSLFVLRGMLGVYLVVWWLECQLRPDEWRRGLNMLGTTLLLGLWMASLGVLISQRVKTSTWAITTAVGATLILAGGYLLIAAPLVSYFIHHDGSEMVLAGAMVYLEAFWLWYSPHRYQHRFDPIAVYQLGVLVYGLATIAVTAVSIQGFERMARELGPRRFVIPSRSEPLAAPTAGS
ncbi:MAG: ABC transporter permease subunit [Pirellulales bacterium]|nr:ABC transporter permease subunit [Pirellulales bacterium]